MLPPIGTTGDYKKHVMNHFNVKIWTLGKNMIWTRMKRTNLIQQSGQMKPCLWQYRD